MVFLNKSLDILVDFDQKADFFASDDFLNHTVEDLPSLELSPAEFFRLKQFRFATKNVVVFEIVEFFAKDLLFNKLMFLDFFFDFEVTFVQKPLN